MGKGLDNDDPFLMVEGFRWWCDDHKLPPSAY